MGGLVVCFIIVVLCMICMKVCDFMKARFMKKQRKLLQKLTGEVFCEECVSIKRDRTFGQDFSKCLRTKKEEDKKGDYLVSGLLPNKTYYYGYCAVERGSACKESCGPTGKFYVEKV
jgi:hypothetical protein